MVVEKLKIREWRENKKVLLQEDVAAKLGYAISYISGVENGTIKPSVKFRKAFIESFGREEYDSILEFPEGK